MKSQIADLETIANVYDTCQSSKTAKTILQNKYHEIDTDDKGLFLRSLARTEYRELSTKQGEILGLIKRLCRLLNLKSTHDTEPIISYDHIKSQQDHLETTIKQLFALLGLRDHQPRDNNKSEHKPQDPVIKVAKTISRIFKDFGGLGLESITKQARVEGSKCRIYKFRIIMPPRSYVADMIRLVTP